MTELIERLRVRARYHMVRTNDGIDCSLLREAAAEIERLRAELMRLRDAGCDEDLHVASPEIATCACGSTAFLDNPRTGYYTVFCDRSIREGCWAGPSLTTARGAVGAWNRAMEPAAEIERLREALRNLIEVTQHLDPCPGTLADARAALGPVCNDRRGE